MSSFQDATRKDGEAGDMPAIEHIWTAMQKSRLMPGRSHHAEMVSPAHRSSHDAVWPTLRSRTINATRAAYERVVTTGRPGPARNAFDMMRTRVLTMLREDNWSTVAITSPTHGCGKSVVAANLALSLAHQKECRTLLVDLNLRHPGIAETLDIVNPPAIEEFLKGNIDLERFFLRIGDNLAVAPNGRPVSLAAETLQSAETSKALREMQRRLMPNVVLYDLPPMFAYDDMIAFLPNVDCAILVAEAEATTLAEVDACERELASRTNVLGTVLNKCRHVDAATMPREGA